MNSPASLVDELMAQLQGAPMQQMAQAAPRAMEFRGASDTIEQFGAAGAETLGQAEKGTAIQAPIHNATEVGRNDPCPCGSGLKYKKCGMVNGPQHKS